MQDLSRSRPPDQQSPQPQLEAFWRKNVINYGKNWSGYRESNPGIQLGRLLLYH